MLDVSQPNKEDQVAFEIYLNKEESKLKGLLRFQELEKRLASIEKTIGVGQNLKVNNRNFVFFSSIWLLTNYLVRD